MDAGSEMVIFFYHLGACVRFFKKSFLIIIRLEACLPAGRPGFLVVVFDAITR